MNSRFDYVKYDDTANTLQAVFKESFINLEKAIEAGVTSPRAKALAITHLETVYMWIGKGIRDDQIVRNRKTILQEDRHDG